MFVLLLLLLAHTPGKTVATFYIFEHAAPFSPSSETYSSHIESLVNGAGVECNSYNDPRAATGWHARCLLPCVQYGLFDEPYFNHSLTVDMDEEVNLARPLCPCFNGTVYQIDREYEGAKGAFMSEWHSAHALSCSGPEIANLFSDRFRTPRQPHEL